MSLPPTTSVQKSAKSMGWYFGGLIVADRQASMGHVENVERDVTGLASGWNGRLRRPSVEDLNPD